jgi:NHS family xanthosine MFS transporter
MSWSLYISLSLMMFLEYTVWGAWYPVLATRLLGPLKMSGKQAGWIYATLPLACIFVPLVAGQVADRWLNTEWMLAGAHLVGAVLLLAAARQEKFAPLFVIMLLYSFCYAATMPLVNSLMFYQLDKVLLSAKAVDEESVKIFIWGPIAWAVIGYFLTGWRAVFKTEGRGRDCLLLAAALSIIMGVSCLWLPATPSSGAKDVLAQTLSMLAKPNFLTFLLISLVIAGLMQFYFLGTGRFMQDMGISGKVISGAMAIAQVAQTVGTWFLLAYCIKELGFQWTLVVGAAFWVALYVVYMVGRPRWLVVLSQSFHGLAYVLFIIAGQVYAKSVAPASILASVQAMVFVATVGIGLFLGTQAAGRVMDRFSVQGKFQWRPIWLVPCVVMLAGVVALAAFFHG